MPLQTVRATVESVPAAVRAGVRDITPSFLGLFPFALLVGVTIAESGVNDWLGFLSSLLLFSGSAQLTAVTLLDPDCDPVVLLATVFVMTLRLALYGAALEPHFRSQPRWFRWAAPQLIVDQTFAVASARTDVDTPAAFRRYWLGAGCSLAVMWVGVVGAGILLGPVIPQGTPLEFAPVAVFICLLVRRLTDRPSAAAAAAAGVVAAAAAGLPQGSGVLVAALCGVVVATATERRKP